MRSIRRVGALAAVGVLLTAVATGSAGADTPASYTGAASGYALRLSGLGQTFTAGGSEAKAASDGTSAATGTGTSPVAASIAKATNPPGETKPEQCAASLPPAPLNTVLKLGLGCGEASATGTGLETIAAAGGKVGTLDVTLDNVLSGPLAPVTGPLVTTVDTTVDSLCNPLPSPLKEACLAAGNTVDQVVESVVSTQTLAAEVGSSSSGVTVNGGTVTSQSVGSGAVVEILPEPTLDGVQLSEPLATITVARAAATVVCTLSDGKAVPSFDPALVRVKLAAAIVALIPSLPDLLPKVTLPGGELDPDVSLTDGELTVEPGAKVVLFAGLPIQTEIMVAAGTAKVNPDGSATASSSGVKVHALQLAPAPLTGGLLFDLAHAEAAGACVAASVTPPAIETPRELPRTGGTPWLPVAGVAALAVAVVTRRAIARSH